MYLVTHSGVMQNPEQSPYTIPLEPASCLFCENKGTHTVARGRDYEYESTPDIFELARCRSCDLIFIQPRPAVSAREVIYPENYYAYHEGEDENAFIKHFRDRMESAKTQLECPILMFDADSETRA